MVLRGKIGTGRPRAARGADHLGRCGRRLQVVYTGKTPAPKYRCDRPNLMLGLARCMAFGAWRVDEVVGAALIRAVEPMALQAPREADQMRRSQESERRRMAELELEKARYEAQLAERRYAACDPDNRLIAAQLEKSWEVALHRVRLCEQRLESRENSSASPIDADVIEGLADDLQAAWSAPSTTMRTRQRLVRVLIEDIVEDLDEATGEIVLRIHWRGGQHSELRTRKPRSGEHRRRASGDAHAVICSMASKWPDDQIAGVSEPNGPADRPGTIVDGQTCPIIPTHARHPRLSIRREGRPVADAERGRTRSWRHEPHDPSLDTRRSAARRAGGAPGAVPDSRCGSTQRRCAPSADARRWSAEMSGQRKNPPKTAVCLPVRPR